MQEKVSVIIPTYKRPDRLTRSVNSVLNQTYSNFEIIVVDDNEFGDESAEVIENLADERIIFLKNQRSKGANGARNTGIVNSTGQYLAFLDDDDEWLPINLLSQLDRIRGTDENTGMVYGAYLMEKKTKWVENIQNKEGDLFVDLMLDQLYVGASSNIFIKKKVISEVGLWDEELLRQQDLEFLLRVFKKYQIVFNQNIIAKIYGHNDPAPNKSFMAREEFLKKTLHQLEKLSDNHKRIFLSNHYRRQSMYLVQMKNYSKAFLYWKNGFNSRKISIKKDVRILLALLKSSF